MFTESERIAYDQLADECPQSFTFEPPPERSGPHLSPCRWCGKHVNAHDPVTLECPKR